jgi:hypothetical protein
MVPENHGDGKKASIFVRSDQKATRRNIATGFSISGGQHFGKWYSVGNRAAMKS